MVTATKPNAGYVLGTTSAEHNRLTRQGRLISKLTEHFLEEIGLTPGMRVLDVGSGLGDVALLAAPWVGNSGEIVCVDTDASALAIARERAVSAGFDNIQFYTCDVHRFSTSVVFDAVIGRCVLLHQSDPVAALKAVLQHLRSDGIVAFQEPWFSRAFSYPEAALFQKMLGWLHETVHKSGLDGDIGARLPALYMSAGLTIPQLSFETLVDSGEESEIYDFCVETARSLLPRIEELGISTAEEIQVETLAQRLRTEARALGSVIGVMPLMGAWTKMP